MVPRAPERPRGEAGFTLVELMIVLAVMGLLAGVAVWRWPSGGDDARAEAQILATRLAAARDQAIIEGRPIAIVVEPAGYRFEQRRGWQWQPLQDASLRERRLRSGVQAEGGARGIRIRFDSTGLPAAAATLRLRSGGHASQVELLADGEVRVS